MRKYKKFTVFNFSLFLLTIAILSSCVKSRDGGTTFDNLQPNVLIREGGLATFNSQALVFPASDDADTAYFRVNYAGKEVAPNDITITLSYDDNARIAYNNGYLTSSDSPYSKFPDSVYSFTTTTVTIKAGQQFSDPIPIIIYPGKVDPTKNYMFPVTITNANGVNISGNFGTIYYHLIGNVLAGTYIRDWYRWNNSADTTGPPNSTISLGVEETISPISGTTILFPEGYLDANGLGPVSVSFSDSSGFIVNPMAFIGTTTKANLDAVGFKVLDGPKIVDYQILGNAANNYAGTYFRMYIEILNNTGGDRKTVNVFTKQ